MIKTIKVKKNLRLDELIKYIFDNGIKAENGWIKYRTKYDGMVTVDMSGQINVCGAHLGNEVYTVEVEEEITEDTVFDSLTEVFYDSEDKKIATVEFIDTSIDFILGEQSINLTTLAIYYGKSRIWEAE